MPNGKDFFEENEDETENDFPNSSDRQKIIYIAIGVGLALIVLFSVLAFFAAQKKSGAALKDQKTKPAQTAATEAQEGYNYTPSTADSCSKIKISAERQRCLDMIAAGNAIDDMNFKACSLLQTAELKYNCQHVVAKNAADSSLCAKIANEQTRSHCFSDVAIATKDITICEKNGQEIDEVRECMDRTLAFVIAESGKTDDIDQCGRLETLEYENLCLMNSFKNKFGDNCDLVPEEFKNYCNTNKIINSNPAAEDCAKIVMGTARDTNNYRNFCLKISQAGMQKAAQIDSDNDGLTDGNELFMKTDPNNPDTDGDAVADGAEWVAGTDPGNIDDGKTGAADGKR